MPLLNPHAVDQEIEVLAAQLSVLQRQEDDFARILSDMNRLLESVQTEKMALTSKIAELHRQKIPVNWLPPELLIQIFLICAEDEHAETSTSLPYNPAPVVISHVCHTWRELALVTSQLWSFISYRSIFFTRLPIEMFLDRSGCSELTLTFVSPLDEIVQDAPLLATAEHNTTEGLIELLTPHFPRVRSITFECHFTITISSMFRALSMGRFPKLQYLDLAVSSQDPGIDHPTLVPIDEAPGEDAMPTNSALADLRLEQTLELSYSRRRTTLRQPHLPTMSRVIQLLEHTPHLHELSMIGVTPLWDVAFGTQASHQGTTSLQETRVSITAIDLRKLRRLSLQYVYYRDVYPFLSLLNSPQLERLDLLIVQSSSKRYDVPLLRGNHIGDQDSFTLTEPLTNVVALHSLKELNVSCQNEDTSSLSLRQFLFPVLEKLDIAFVGRHLRREPGLPALSRLESIFRDPRLTHLTHLTLSYLDIPLGHGKAMLSYMPNLISLTLGGCTGVGVVLTALAESYGRVPSGQGSWTSRVCGVRICPRLEELVLWSCNDFQFETLYSVVRTRSSLVDTSTPAPDVAGVDVASAVLGRQIRPLKKHRSANTSQSADVGLHAASGVISTFIPIQEALHPSSVTCVHLEDCPSIRKDQVFSLEELGAVVTLR
ncbi:hypothetical protein J3A83DRAFT_964810 [Scleroderma citrinum]